MIQRETRLKAADNTGARSLMCIGMLGGTGKKYGIVDTDRRGNGIDIHDRRISENENIHSFNGNPVMVIGNSHGNGI